MTTLNLTALRNLIKEFPLKVFNLSIPAPDLPQAAHQATNPDKEDELLAELTRIISNREISILYQPLVSLHTGKIFGYEALSRGPENSKLTSPGALFPAAEAAGLLYPLEKLARETAIRGMPKLSPEQRLFLNINPGIISDPKFTTGETRRLLESIGLAPRNIVFEITERTSIKDFNQFRQVLEHYRDQGFGIAVDDAGAGYSSLQSIAELHPEFIKIDMSLIKNVDKNPVKKALIETFVTFAQKINSEIIAEGIETPQELKVLMEMGIHYGQGYFLARPANPVPAVNMQAREVFAMQFINPGEYMNADYHPIRQLIHDVRCIKPETVVADLVTYFNHNQQVKAVVVAVANLPLGLIMRDQLFLKLANQYGPALYWKKQVDRLMDAQPLVVESRMPIHRVANLAMNRTSKKLYDYVIVTENKKLLGVVSVQSLLNTVTIDGKY